MTKILILGGGGMIGQKLARDLIAHGWQGARPHLTLHDIAFGPDAVTGDAQITGTLTEPGIMAQLAAGRPDIVFHLASIVSGEAEQEFDKGWQVNMFPTWALLEALRAEQEASGGSYRARVVFSSSIAVFGAPFPDAIDDTFLTAPLTSYGAQKAACELMVSDFARKGFVDGMSIRLPTICVRPGLPNKAASGFFSGIIREPLNGAEAILPVEDTVRHWHASPKSAIGFLRHAAGLDTDLLQGRRVLNMPGFSCTVAEQIEALRDIAGSDVVARIKRQPDPEIAAIVAGWPRNFSPDRALALGFEAETSFHQIIQTYIDEELGGSRPV